MLFGVFVVATVLCVASAQDGVVQNGALAQTALLHQHLLGDDIPDEPFVPGLSSECLTALISLYNNTAFHTAMYQYQTQNPECFDQASVHTGYSNCTIGLDTLDATCHTMGSRVCEESMVLARGTIRVSLDFGECYPNTCSNHDIEEILHNFDVNYCGAYSPPFDECTASACGITSDDWRASGSDGGLSGGQKAGIAIGTLVGVGLVAVGGLWCYKRRQARTPSLYAPMTTSNTAEDDDALGYENL